jgi:RNA polymerase sigma-70 factor, ECF subfamily
MIDELAMTGRTRQGPADADRAAAFSRLVDGDLTRSYRLASLLLGSEPEAQDVVQDAVVTAWERFDQLRDLDRFDAWFGRILVNACRDRLRRRGRVKFIALGEDGAGAGVMGRREVAVAGPDLAERDALRDALARLSPEHREVVAMRYLLDLPLDEIAERTGERLGTVKSRLHYGLSALRAAYDAADRETRERSR